LGGNEINNNETEQAENKAAALKVKKEEVKEENKIFSDKSYIPEDRMFAVII
jgi:hypothetical protein